MTRGWEFATSLPLPPPVNRTNRQTVSIRRHRHFSSPEAQAWMADALVLLRMAGLKPLPTGHYQYRVVSTLHCGATRDLDSSAKLVLDAVKKALDVDDKHCYEYVLRKVTTPTRAKHRLHLAITVESLQ